MSEDPEERPALGAAEPAAPSPARWQPRSFLTILSALALLPWLALIVWPSSPATRLAMLVQPERDLALVVGVSMDLHEAAARAPAGRRRIYRLLGLEDAEDLPQAIAWFEELARESAHPGVDAHLATLEAEGGRLDALRRRLDTWAERDEPLPALADLLRAAYLPEAAAPASALALGDEAGELVSPGWFRDRLEIALAVRRGDDAAARAVTARLAARSDVTLWRAQAAIGAQLLAVLLGAVALAARVRRRPLLPVVGTAPIPPPWPGGLGGVVILRGAALGVVALTGLYVWDVMQHEHVLGAADVLMGGIMVLPVLALTYLRLFRPAGLGGLEGFGLAVVPGGARRLVPVIPVVIALVLVGEWVIGGVAGLAQASGHWAEWFDEDLVFGGRAAMATTLIGAIVLAPITEELTFRGLVFVALRRRFAWPAAGTLTALAFAALHGYGVAGFLSVWWSGLVWSWAYERTHSLWPAIAGHAAANLFATLLVVGVLR